MNDPNKPSGPPVFTVVMRLYPDGKLEVLPEGDILACYKPLMRSCGFLAQHLTNLHDQTEQSKVVVATSMPPNLKMN